MGAITQYTGSELVANITAGNSVVISKISVNPYTINAPWLNRAVSMYNKYKYVTCRLRYSPFCPTSTSGRLILASSGDVSDTTNPISVQQVAQYSGSREMPVWMEGSVSLSPTRKPEFIVSPTDNNDSSAGTFFVGVDNGDVEGTAAGSLYLDYTINCWSRAAPTSQ